MNLNEQINKLNQDILDNPEYYDRKVWRETRINPKEVVYTCRGCKAEPTEGDSHEDSCTVAEEILDNGTCPECNGSNLFPEDHPVKCFDCDASDYE